MEIGIDSFVSRATDAGIDDASRMRNLLEEITIADRVGVDVFGIGEHHRQDALDAAPAVILAAAAARTQRIRLTSAVTVLSAADPVRVFQDYATVDLISNGRAEIVVGRGSSIEAYPLFGFDLNDYDALFEEKLELLLRIRDQNPVTWSGRFRPALNNLGVYPRPVQQMLPIWRGVGGTPESFARAGLLGLPLMVAIIGGEFRRFRPLVDLYREASRRAGHDPATQKVGVHAIGFVGDDDKAAREDYFPGWQRRFTKIGRERGWGDATRAQFDAMVADGGAYLIGDPDHVASKLLAASEELGGVDRFTFQMTGASDKPEVMNRAIELLGQEVIPRVRKMTANT